MKTTRSVRRLTTAGLIAALYAAMTMLIPVAAFGSVQFRVSEMLTVLPIFTPAAIPGLAIGCFLSNLLGLTTGANPAGAWDLLFGPVATLAAAALSYRWRHIRLKGLPVLSTLPPVILNALVVGLELDIALFGFSPAGYALCAAEVAAGQLGACVVCGLLLWAALEKSALSKTLFADS